MKCNASGEQLACTRTVEPTAMFIHAAVHRIARKSLMLHTRMPHATALTLTAARALDTNLSQTAMRFHGLLAVDAWTKPAKTCITRSSSAKRKS